MGDTDAPSSQKLPLDVLMEVMAVSQLAAAALMGIYQVLHALGPPYVLIHGVTFCTRSQMASFEAFMLADTTRLAYMRLTSVPTFSTFEVGSGQIVRGAVHPPATTLNTLDRETVSYNPRLLPTIGTLASLKHLHVHGVGLPVSNRNLRELEHGTLHVLTLSISFQTGDGEGVVAEDRLRDTFGALTQRSRSLKVVVNVPSSGFDVLLADREASVEDT
ncbi:hypothetical protein GSI_05011 [Ganoderma sinense ZZ0214-1]|uniref:Uncharacterized protein n=1 Tax=Ganoderma sinense ZZ0214-1 TaxID=1077348 RepID=A0A2G8SGK8_9APHY|nr:hypothetical protein GSI_05011 [Ganoderma sinense ZZ0214-1]